MEIKRTVGNISFVEEVFSAVDMGDSKDSGILVEESDSFVITYFKNSKGEIETAYVNSKINPFNKMHCEIRYDKNRKPFHIIATNEYSGEVYEERHRFDNHGFIRKSVNSIGDAVKRKYQVETNTCLIINPDSGESRELHTTDPHEYLEGEDWMLCGLGLI